jgi:hypothetical protein
MQGKGLVIVYSLFYLLISQSVLCQTDIDYYNESILKFHIPRLEYASNNVRQVSVYEESNGKKKVLQEVSEFDNKGYINRQEKFDYKVLNGSEIARIHRSKNGQFIVEREIEKLKLLNATAETYGFWQFYFPMVYQVKADKSKIIRVRSEYTYLQDSNIKSSTWLNGIKIDSGVLFISITSDLHREELIMSTDSTKRNDSLFISRSIRIDDSVTHHFLKVFYANKIFRDEKLVSVNGSNDFQASIRYAYNNEDKLVLEEYSTRNRTYKRRFYEYDSQETTYNVRVEEYLISDTPLISIFDMNGRLLEKSETYYSGGLVNETIKYFYLKNGLIDEIHVVQNGELARRKYYLYKYRK